MVKISAQNSIIDKVMDDIPTVDELVEKALKKVLRKYKDKITLKKNFGPAITELEETLYKYYQTSEKRAYKQLLKLWTDIHGEDISKIKRITPNELEKILWNISPYVRRFEFRASQMRKARAGKSFEKSVFYLLREIGKKCEFPKGEARKKLKRIDIVLPNQKVALERPDKAYFLSCKHTLRERWKQTIPERKPNWRVFLLTLDNDLPEDKAIEINALGMVVYVKDSLKSRSALRDKTWVRRLSNLPKDLK